MGKDHDLDEVTRLYVTEGRSLNAVAARLGCSQTTVTRRLIAAVLRGARMVASFVTREPISLGISPRRRT